MNTCAELGSFQPFGLGTKSCPGSRFAKTELMAIVTTLVRLVDIAGLEGEPDYDGVLTLTMGPKDDACRMAIRAR
jgi:cytochrome P450